MKLECLNCTTGPCFYESKSDDDINESRCFFRTTRKAKWKAQTTKHELPPIEKSNVPDMPNIPPPPPKESELMTLQEALVKIKNGEYLKNKKKKGFIYADKEQGLFYKEGSGRVQLYTPDLTCKIWQIIPAEPEVLSAEQMHYKMFEYSLPGGLACKDYTIRYGKAMDKNGELKQWLNHKELRELLKEWTSSVVVLKDYTERVEKALKNLKPLKPE